jgi:hypothetical protein
LKQTSGALRRENASLYLPSLRGAKRPKQSILSLRGEMDCFASPAMTVPLFEIRIRLQPISLHRAR